MHRILVAHDGSEYADRAVSLVGGLPWPADCVIRLVTAVPGTGEMRHAWGPLVIDDSDDLGSRVAKRAEGLLEPARDQLASRGLTVETSVAEGRPPQAIAAAATRFGATLVVVGSRGLGPIEGAILGSVSAEVADIAPCPVLVARGPSVRSIVLATDGSPAALLAEQFLATLPIARLVPVHVLSVAEILWVWGMALPGAAYGQMFEAHETHRAAVEQGHRAIADEAATRLHTAGVEARVRVVTGDPASEVLTTVRSVGADLVVLGTRGRTGLRRLVLGSVARRVLQHADASVLVVREGVATEAAEEVGRGSHVAGPTATD